jgi:hypothetical protein
MAPWGYAQLQVLQQAVAATESLDDSKLGDYIRANTFKTVLGDVRFGSNGEWAKSRVLQVQFPEHQEQRSRPVQGHVDPGGGGTRRVRVGQVDLSVRECKVSCRSRKSGAAPNDPTRTRIEQFIR